uniref:F-box domain-containing protein n=1 Tax=Strongyloides stercoralis TaxID=6248 RepID=A0A0K0E815_STRER
METNKNLSILDIIGIGLIRKKIFQNIPSFNDISNFSKTCKWINSIIQSESISRNVVLYKDYQFIGIKINEESTKNEDTFNIPSFDNIEFINVKKNYQELMNEKYFFGEIISSKIYIKFCLYNEIKKLEGNDYVLFINKIVEKINLSSESRKNAKCLSLWNDMVDHNINLYMISCLKHDNIQRIEVSNNFLNGDIEVYKKNNNNIFNGFPKFNEFVIDFSIPIFPIYKFDNILENNDVLEYIMKDLSKINNLVLILNHTTTDNILFNKYIFNIYKIAKKYGINIKYTFGYYQKSANAIISISKTSNYFIFKDNLTSISCSLENSTEFLEIIILSQHLYNLQNLQLTFNYFDIKKNLKKMIILNYKYLSFKHCKKLKNVTFIIDYIKSPELNNLEKEKIVERNLKYLSSLMGENVEILKLINFNNLTKNVIEELNKFMPNIKFLETMYVLYECPLSLNLFKNLKFLRCITKGQLQIPKTLKLFSIRQFEDKKNESNKYENGEVIKMYKESFTKCIKSENEEYIFFNNILHWDVYKNLVQNFNCN